MGGVPGPLDEDTLNLGNGEARSQLRPRRSGAQARGALGRAAAACAAVPSP
jgi:hypothetical protein